MKDKTGSEAQSILLNDEIFDQSPVGIFIADTSGNILTENSALKNFFDREAEKKNAGLIFYKFIHSDEKLRGYFNQAAQNKKPVRIGQIKYALDTEAKERIINIWITPVLDAQGEIKHYLFHIDDKTKHALYDSKMQRAEKLTAMGVIASGIAEEIKWPMSHIMINLDFVERNTPEDSPMRPYLQAIRDDLSRIKFVSKQIMNLSMPQNENKDSNEIYEINGIFSSSPIKYKLNVLKERGINIKTQVPDKPVKIRADKNKIIQAMTHIIQNSAEAMPEEGTLSLSINSMIENNHEVVLITISDTGIGIPQDTLTNVFKPFFSTKGKNATGLGLMVSYSIIESLGGAIGIRSTPGEGTTIQIVLPAYSE